MAGWKSRYSPEEAGGTFNAVPVPRSVVAADAARAATSVLAEATLTGADMADSLIRARQVADSVVRSRSPLRDGARSRPGELEAQGGVLYAPRSPPPAPAALLPRDLVRAVPQLTTLRGVADGDPYSGGPTLGGGGASALQPGGVRPEGAPRRRGSRSPSPTRHRRPVISRPASPAGQVGGVDTPEVPGNGAATACSTAPLPAASFPPAAGAGYNARGVSTPGGVSLGCGEEEAQYPTLPGPASAPSIGFTVAPPPPPAHHGNIQPLPPAPPPVQITAPAALPAAKPAPGAAVGPVAQPPPQAPLPSRPVLPQMTASALAPRADVAPQAAPAAPVEEEVSSPTAPPAGWAASRQTAPATSGGPSDDGGFTFSFSPPVQKAAVELPPLFKGFAHNEPAAGKSIDAGWAAGMTPQAQRAQEALPKVTAPPPAAPGAPRTHAAQPPQAPPAVPAPHSAPAAAPTAPIPPPQQQSQQQVAPPVSPSGPPVQVSPALPLAASEQPWQQQQQWQRPPMVSRETQTVESELAASAPARRYIHGAEERVAPPGGPGGAPAAAQPAPPPRGGPDAAAFERVRPMSDEEPDDGTWYDWWIRARLC